MFGKSAMFELLLVAGITSGSIRGQNQTPANLPPPPPRGVWKDPDTGLMWAKKDNGSDLTQSEALEYCRNLSLAGFRDWRLPNFDELQQIYDPSVVSGSSSSSDGSRYDLHGKGGIVMTGGNALSATRSSRQGETMVFNFGGGPRGSVDATFSFQARALCVRRAVD
jgi:hypothetical protein